MVIFAGPNDEVQTRQKRKRWTGWNVVDDNKERDKFRLMTSVARLRRKRQNKEEDRVLELIFRRHWLRGAEPAKHQPTAVL